MPGTLANLSLSSRTTLYFNVAGDAFCATAVFEFMEARNLLRQINVGIIGTGWCGGIRAETCARHPLVKSLHLAETRPERLAEVAKATGAQTATADYQQIIGNETIDAVMISATPEHLHYPMARDALLGGKHVFLEKPIALELHEADELIAIARKNALKFTIGYSQRFNPKFAYVKKCATDGTLGKPVSALVSRHIGRSLGKKITGRTKLSPAAMEATHDLDFHPVVPRAGQAGTRVFAGQLRRDESGQRRRCPRHAVHHGHHGQRRLVCDLRRAGACRPPIPISR